MDAEELVDAALTGFVAGEDVTIPSLPERADWDAFNAARARLGRNLSRQHAADRHRRAAAQWGHIDGPDDCARHCDPASAG